MARSSDAREPRMPAITSQGRCRVAAGATRVLDEDAGDARRHPVRPALARREGERAGVPHVDPRARQRRQVPHLRSAVQQRHVLLDRVHAAAGFRHCRAYRAYLARLRDVPRYFDEQIANMRAGLARGYHACRACPCVGRDKTIEPYVEGDATNPLYAPFTQMPADVPARPTRTAMRAEARRRHSRRRRARRTRSSDVDPRRVPAEGAHDARGDGAARWRGVLPGADREVHDADAHAAADPRDRPEGSRAHRGGDGGHQAEGGLQGDHGGVLQVPAHRPAVLREDAARAARRLGVRGEEGRREARRDDRFLPRHRHGDPCRCPMHSRRSTRVDAAGSRRA